MPEIGTSGLMSGDGKRGVAEWPKLPRPSSTLYHSSYCSAGPCPVLEEDQKFWRVGRSDAIDPLRMSAPPEDISFELTHDVFQALSLDRYTAAS